MVFSAAILKLSFFLLCFLRMLVRTFPSTALVLYALRVFNCIFVFDFFVNESLFN